MEVLGAPRDGAGLGGEFFIPLVALFTFSWASLAYGFAVLRPSAYGHPEQMSFWLMVKHYLWQLVDLVPFVEVWKAIHIEDPVKEASLWPGALVVIYRLVMLYLVFSAAATLFGLKKGKEKTDVREGGLPGAGKGADGAEAGVAAPGQTLVR